MALDEQPVFQLGIFFDSCQRRIDIGDLTFGIQQVGVFPFEQSGPCRVGQLAVWLADLHASQVQELAQQLLPLRGHGHHAELFHFYNGHISASQPFPQ